MLTLTASLGVLDNEADVLLDMLQMKETVKNFGSPGYSKLVLESGCSLGVAGTRYIESHPQESVSMLLELALWTCLHSRRPLKAAALGTGPELNTL